MTIQQTITVWPKNYATYINMLNQGYIHGIAVTPDGKIAAEVRMAQKLRIIILADPKTFTIVHSCQNGRSQKIVPCWHMAAALDVIAYVNKQRIVIQGNRPIATVNAINRFVKPDNITGGCRDITSSFMRYKGLTPHAGDFKLVQIADDLPEQKAGKQGLWDWLRSRVLLGGVTR